MLKAFASTVSGWHNHSHAVGVYADWDISLEFDVV